MSQASISLRKELIELLDYSDELQTIDKEAIYFKRFPTCCHVRDVICADDSSYSKCPEGVYGELGGQAMTIPWDGCSTCLRYKKKER